MRLNIIDKFKEKSKSFKITAVIAAVVIVVLTFFYIKSCKNVPAESITLPQDKIYLEQEMKYVLSPKIKPFNVTENNICYKIANENVVRIVNNEIIPITIGSTDIYCYDKTTGLKSKPMRINVVESISKLIPETETDNEDELISGSDKNARYVYFTKSGKKYHLENCSSLGKNSLKTVLSNAQSKGLTPCQKCKPYVDTN